MNETGGILAIIFSSGAFLTGLGALFAVFLNRKSSKETTTVTHSNVVFEGYGELVDRVQTQSDKFQAQAATLSDKIEIMSVTITRQGEEIQQLKMELRDSQDQIRMLTLDRDDLVALVTGPRPNLRTI